MFNQVVMEEGESSSRGPGSEKGRLEGTEEAVRVFEQAREWLRASVQAEVFKVWVRPLRPLGFRDGSLVVAVPDPAFSCYLASEGQAGLGGLTMQAWLESLIGHGVEFVLKEPHA